MLARRLVKVLPSRLQPYTRSVVHEKQLGSLDAEIAAAARRLESLRLQRQSLFERTSQGKQRDSTSDSGDAEEQTDQRRFMPLDGVRVLDLSRILAGPFCTMIMGDLGAEVIKVEKKGSGDDTRSWGPPFVNGESSYFLCVNRNKKSMTVDLRNSEAKRLLYRLVKQSDVVVENFIPGAADKLSIGYEDMKRHNPAIIYASISGYGSTGPYRNRPGYDVNIAALGGMMSVTGERGGGPVKVGVALTDIITGLMAQGCISSALLERTRTGKGKHIELSLLDCQVASLANVASAYLNGGVVGTRWGTAHASIVPYQAFQARDGFVVISANNDDQWKRLCHVLERPDLAADERFATNAKRVANRDVLIEQLSISFLERNRSDWISLLSEQQLSACPINTVAEVFEDPQVVARGMKQKLAHPTAGDVYLPGIPFLLDGTRPEPRLPPPTLGQHTHTILRDILCMNDSEIVSLEESGAL